MTGFTDYLENKILDHLRGNAYPVPAGLFVGLFSSSPTDAGGGTEVTTTIRAAGRPQAAFGAPDGTQMATSAIVDFGASAGTATVSHFAVFDAASAGNMLWYGPMATTLQITPGISVSMATAALVLGLD